MMNQLKTLLLLGVLTALMVGLGSALAPGAMELFLVLALVTNLGAYFYSDRIVLSLHRARELSFHEAPELHRTVRQLAARASIPPPRLYLIPSSSPNAFATGRNPENAAVAVTEGILRTLSPRELRGVLAHELAHVANRDVLIATIAAALATVVSYMGSALQWSLMLGFGGHDEDGPSPLGAFVMALVAPVAATLIQLAVSRSREYLADEAGARYCGDPEALASALVRLEQGVARAPNAAEPATASLFIVSPLTGDGMSSWFSTHPSTRERVERLMRLAGGSPARLGRVA